MKNPILQNFIANFFWKPKPKPEPVTVQCAIKEMNRHHNHEMWRTCNSCGDHFDVKKETAMRCPICGSVDLRIGNKL